MTDTDDRGDHDAHGTLGATPIGLRSATRTWFGISLETFGGRARGLERYVPV